MGCTEKAAHGSQCGRCDEAPATIGIAATSAAKLARSQKAAVAPPAADHWRTVTCNGYAYKIDGKDHTWEATGTLVLNADKTRSRAAQSGAGGGDRLPTDEGGHYIARRFNGPTEKFNHFAQDGNFNRSGYRALENDWASETKAGKNVSVVITPKYSGSSQRPNAITVKWTVDGHLRARFFSNSS